MPTTAVLSGPNVFNNCVSGSRDPAIERGPRAQAALVAFGNDRVVRVCDSRRAILASGGLLPRDRDSFCRGYVW